MLQPVSAFRTPVAARARTHSVTGALGRAVGVPVGRLQLHALVLAAHLEKRTHARASALRFGSAAAALTWLTCRRVLLPSPRRTGSRRPPGRSLWCGRRRRRPCIRRTGPCGRSSGCLARCGRTASHTSHPWKTAAGQRAPAWDPRWAKPGANSLRLARDVLVTSRSLAEGEVGPSGVLVVAVSRSLNSA